MTSEPAVVVRGLHKAYDAVDAVAGVDLTISRGEVFALLGLFARRIRKRS